MRSLYLIVPGLLLFVVGAHARLGGENRSLDDEGRRLDTGKMPPLDAKEKSVACKNDFECGHGTCVSVYNSTIKYCKCEEKYATKDSSEPCEYKRTSQLVVLLLQIFLGVFPIAPFILGWTTVGIVISMMWAVCCCGFCCSTGCLSDGETRENSRLVQSNSHNIDNIGGWIVGSILILLAAIVLFIFWILDLVWVLKYCVDGDFIACYEI